MRFKTVNTTSLCFLLILLSVLFLLVNDTRDFSSSLIPSLCESSGTDLEEFKQRRICIYDDVGVETLVFTVRFTDIFFFCFVEVGVRRLVFAGFLNV